MAKLVTVNRAPVLALWGAVVAEVLGAEAIDKGVGEVKHELKTEGGRQVLLLTAPQKPDPIATVIAVRFKDQPAVAG